MCLWSCGPAWILISSITTCIEFSIVSREATVPTYGTLLIQIMIQIATLRISMYVVVKNL